MWSCTAAEVNKVSAASFCNPPVPTAKFWLISSCAIADTAALTTMSTDDLLRTSVKLQHRNLLVSTQLLDFMRGSSGDLVCSYQIHLSRKLA